MNASSRACSSSAALRLALRDQQLLGFEHDDDAARRHHRKRVGGVDQLVDRGVAAVQAIDVEGLQLLLHQVGELAGHRRLLDVVGAEQQRREDRVSPAASCLRRAAGRQRRASARRPRGWRSRRCAPRRSAMRSTELRSWSRNAAPSNVPCCRASCSSYSSRNISASFDHSTSLVRASVNCDPHRQREQIARRQLLLGEPDRLHRDAE